MQEIVIISHQSFKKNDIVKEKISLQDRSHYIRTNTETYKMQIQKPASGRRQQLELDRSYESWGN